MKPVIGIVGHPYINIDENLIFQTTNSIVKKIAEHGGLPIIICPTQIEDFIQKRNIDIRWLNHFEKKDLDEMIQLCDAIIKPGGNRIYEYERYIYEYINNSNIPYLGICAGMQLMSQLNSNQNIVKNESYINHCTNEKYAHKVKIVHGTLLYEILKQDEIKVNSLHNYHIINSGNNNINAYSSDGIIEGIENKDKLFQLGLQWHPEGLDDIYSNEIFDTFINKAYYYKKKIKNNL